MFSFKAVKSTLCHLDELFLFSQSSSKLFTCNVKSDGMQSWTCYSQNDPAASFLLFMTD